MVTGPGAIFRKQPLQFVPKKVRRQYHTVSVVGFLQHIKIAEVRFFKNSFRVERNVIVPFLPITHVRVFKKHEPRNNVFNIREGQNIQSVIFKHPVHLAKKVVRILQMLNESPRSHHIEPSVLVRKFF